MLQRPQMGVAPAVGFKDRPREAYSLQSNRLTWPGTVTIRYFSPARHQAVKKPGRGMVPHTMEITRGAI